MAFPCQRDHYKHQTLQHGITCNYHLNDALEKNVKEIGQDIFQIRIRLSKILQYLKKDNRGQTQIMCQSLAVEVCVKFYRSQCSLYTFIIFLIKVLF
jgi:hypothetical protein